MRRKGYDIKIVTKKRLGKCQDTVRDLMIIVVILAVMETETSGRGTITTGVTIGENRKMEPLLSQIQTAIRGNIAGTIRHTAMVIMIIVIVIEIVIVIVIVSVSVSELKAVHFRQDKWNQAKIS